MPVRQALTGEPVVARFPPQTAKRWPDYCHKPRNRNLCGEIRLKQACGRHSLGRRLFKLPPNCAGACRYKGNAHDRSPCYCACHRCDGNTSNDHGDGARLKVGILLVAEARNCPCRNGLGGTRHATATTMKTWMRREQAFVWFATIVVALVVAAAIALNPPLIRPPYTHLRTGRALFRRPR